MQTVQTVLLVDDEPEILRMLTRVLQRSNPGLAILTAASADEALPILRDRAPDLVVTDLRMPGMDGISFLSLAASEFPGTSRVLMTAYPDLDAAVRAKNAGKVTRLLTKPFDCATFCSVARELLEERRARILRERAFQHALATLERRSAAPGG